MRIDKNLALQKYTEAAGKLQEAQTRLNSAPESKKAEATEKYNLAFNIFNIAQGRMLQAQNSESVGNNLNYLS
jgi:hypothetical protein